MKYLGALAIVLMAGAALADPTPQPATTTSATTTLAAPAKPSTGIAGLNHDSSQPIQVNADAFYADLNAETGTYRGNVVVVQGDMKLHADEVRVVAPDGKARRMEAHGHVVVDSTSGTAIGDQGVYDVVSRIIHLTGHVVLTKNQNVMRGTALDVEMATGQAHLVAVNESGQPGRVQAVFVPPPQNASHKPNQPGKPRGQGQTPAPQTPAAPAPATPQSH